jgi:hypothetical protein
VVCAARHTLSRCVERGKVAKIFPSHVCRAFVAFGGNNIVYRFDDIIETPSRSFENRLDLFENLSGLGNDIPFAHHRAAFVCGGQPGNEKQIPFSHCRGKGVVLVIL